MRDEDGDLYACEYMIGEQKECVDVDRGAIRSETMMHRETAMPDHPDSPGINAGRGKRKR